MRNITDEEIHNNFLNTNACLTDLATIYGVSEPTISRWKAKGKYPEFVKIIHAQIEEINTLNSVLQKSINKELNLQRELDYIKDFFKELSK